MKQAQVEFLRKRFGDIKVGDKFGFTRDIVGLMEFTKTNQRVCDIYLVEYNARRHSGEIMLFKDEDTVLVKAGRDQSSRAERRKERKEKERVDPLHTIEKKFGEENFVRLIDELANDWDCGLWLLNQDDRFEKMWDRNNPISISKDDMSFFEKVTGIKLAEIECHEGTGEDYEAYYITFTLDSVLYGVEYQVGSFGGGPRFQDIIKVRPVVKFIQYNWFEEVDKEID